MEEILIAIGLFLAFAVIAIIICYVIKEKIKLKLKAEMQLFLPTQNKAWRIVRENDTDKAIQVSFEQYKYTVIAVSTKKQNLLIYGIKDYHLGDSSDIIIQWLKVIPFREILN